MKNKAYAIFSLLCFFDCCPMKQLDKSTQTMKTIYKQSCLHKPTPTIKDAIKNGNIEHFAQYCKKRNMLGIEGRKENKKQQFFLNEKYGYDTIFPNTNLFFQICDSQHKNSFVMLQMLLGTYSGNKYYTLTVTYKTLIPKIFTMCADDDNAKCIALQKLKLLLYEYQKYNIRNDSLDYWEEIFHYKKTFLSNNTEVQYYIDSFFSMFDRHLQSNIVFLLKGACEDPTQESLAQLLSILNFTKKKSMDNTIFLRYGITLLCTILNTYENSDTGIDTALKKINALFDYGAFMSLQNFDQTLFILDKLESLSLDNIDLSIEAFLLYLRLKRQYELDKKKYVENLNVYTLF